MLKFLCKQVLSSTFTKISTTFKYSIRYSGEVIQVDQLSQCLAMAAEFFLLDKLAGCEYDSNNTGLCRRRQLTNGQIQVQKDVERSLSFPELVANLDGAILDLMVVGAEDRTLRLDPKDMDTSTDEQFSSDSVNDDCKYFIEATVDQVTDLRKSRLSCCTMESIPSVVEMSILTRPLSIPFFSQSLFSAGRK